MIHFKTKQHLNKPVYGQIMPTASVQDKIKFFETPKLKYAQNINTITEKENALKGFTKSYEISIKNNKDPLI